METRDFVRSAFALVLVAAVHACSRPLDRGDSESHFLADCSGTCQGGLECVCGVCTRACSTAGACTDLNARADCADAPGEGCGSAAERSCDVACLTNDACNSLGSGYECAAGRCRHGDFTPVGTEAGSGGAEGSAASSARASGNGTGSSLFAVDVQTACATPDGHIVPFTTAKELETRVVGDWLQCSPDPSVRTQFGNGLRFLADHTWYSLVQNRTCGYDVISTGFDGYGTWEIRDLHLSLTIVMNSGIGFSPLFSDTGQLWLDAGGNPSIYVHMPTTPDTSASCGVAGDGGQPR